MTRAVRWVAGAGTILLANGCGDRTAESAGPSASSAAYPLEERAEGGLPEHLGIGRPAMLGEITAVDIDIMPDGRGLPPGSGTVTEGAEIYATRCALCHGTELEGTPLGARLVPDPAYPDFPDGNVPARYRTIGNYWPYATTLFDYIRRAMPFDRPGSLTDDEVYAVTAYLLWRNRVIPEDAVMDARSLPAVAMPARDRFVADDRLESDRVR